MANWGLHCCGRWQMGTMVQYCQEILNFHKKQKIENCFFKREILLLKIMVIYFNLSLGISSQKISTKFFASTT